VVVAGAGTRGATEREQTAYERGLRAKRRLSGDELRRKGWCDEEVWAYQQGLKDRPTKNASAAQNLVDTPPPRG
jgi:hypothetical protein